ncbi:hypothetical protein BP6252_02201 [Coleophoma cylindrospora]|uniref:Helicase C-terminal domain-containing protein n=1 Tax=Coleophoma cylindrospora TaxID=1849047 RepID=A0A3D8SEJ0_9HELO|nr:hypothetical protein BP6252_02201 [Coleophoma cylindrospora]
MWQVSERGYAHGRGVEVNEELELEKEQQLPQIWESISQHARQRACKATRGYEATRGYARLRMRLDARLPQLQDFLNSNFQQLARGPFEPLPFLVADRSASNTSAGRSATNTSAGDLQRTYILFTKPFTTNKSNFNMADPAGSGHTEDTPSIEKLISSYPKDITEMRRKGIKQDLYKDQVRLAKCLGLRTANDLGTFLDGPHFAPIFERLWKSHIQPRLDNNQGHGPKITQIQSRLRAAERDGEQKYTDFDLDVTDWDEHDHYALCLFRLVEKNSKHRGGIFYGKPLSTNDMEVRIWQCILRASHSRRRGRRNPKATSSTSGGNLVQANNTNSLSDSALFGKRDLGEEKVTPAPKRKSGDRIPNVLGTAGGRLWGRDVTDTEDVQLGDGESSHQGDVSQGTGLDAAERTPSPDQEELEPDEDGEKPDEMVAMKAGANPNDPWDITTRWGKYISAMAAINSYHDVLNLQRLKRGYTHDPNRDAREQMELRKESDREVAEIVFKNRYIFEPTSDLASTLHQKLEKLLDNKEYQPIDYDGAIQRLHLGSRDAPRFEHMELTITLKPWQVCGIDRALEIHDRGHVRFCVFNDATGLGKSYQLFGSLLALNIRAEDQEKQFQDDYNDYIAARDRREQEEADIENDPGALFIPEELTVVPDEPVNTTDRASPSLYLCPPELIQQSYHEAKKFCPKFNVLAYIGDSREPFSDNMRKVQGKLTQNHYLFDGQPNRRWTIIISSYQTMNTRHGTAELKKYRLNVLNWTAPAANHVHNIRRQDREWPGDLYHRFTYVFCDEAQYFKNDMIGIQTLFEWMDFRMMFGASATILPNAVRDVAGYIKVAEVKRRTTEARPHLEKNANPYKLSLDHAAAAMQFDLEMCKKFIVAATNAEEAGKALSVIYPQFVIRRTYASSNPMNPGKIIGEDMPKLHTRRILCKFTLDEQAEYDVISAQPLAKLIIVRDGKIIYNPRNHRKLVLFSTWTGFQYIERYLKATKDNIATWKRSPCILWDMIKIMRDRMAIAGVAEEAIPALPAQNDVPGILAIFCRGGPKIRALLAFLDEMVIKNEKKVAIWCGIPASQLLIYGITQLLRISAGCYSADVKVADRDDIVNDFTTETKKCFVFIGSFYLGSVGLNLQALANHSFEFDCPPNHGSQQQLIGRLRRIGQDEAVEHFIVEVEGSFHNRQNVRVVTKAIPACMAELSRREQEQADFDDTKEITIPIETCFLTADGELIDELDPRSRDLLPLTAAELAKYILQAARGEGTKYGVEWESDGDPDHHMILPERL